VTPGGSWPIGWEVPIMRRSSNVRAILAGMVVATTIDAAVLAQLADEPPPQPTYGRGIASAPVVSVNPRGDLTFGWRGTF